MRLNKIKLSGFKSFVDPTTFTVPSNLVGIVGPNGCGKSNIIDAVRWVMGESSAKHLRGDSMADVIFNGSSARKPVGQAAIELVFDNSEGRLGGQYAQYTEISIKRQVSRDGTSSYFLNGAKCRRKDITDVFLGTGLGPRSYAIIEQGMISRLIEAHPEDLRLFIEEAAGISKYKERRREAENRIRHTQENLNRLNDLRGELDKQLGHLQRQAKTAERYKELKDEERTLRSQLQALRWRALDEQFHTHERGIAEQDNAYEKLVADLRNVEAEIERLRQDHIEKTDQFNEVQGRFYGVGAEIARLEQNIQHLKDRRAQLQQDIETTERELTQARTHYEVDQRQIAEQEALLATNEPALEQALRTEQISGDALTQAEQAVHDVQAVWDAFQRESADATRAAEVERTHIKHVDDRMLQLAQRRQRLSEEQSRIDPHAQEQRIGELEMQCEQFDAETSIEQEQLQLQIKQINEQRDDIHRATTELDQARNRLQTVRGRHASLEALQQAALGKRHGAVTDWLDHRGLKEAKRLAQGVEAQAGWERAVETVLGFYLEAVCVDGMDPFATHLEELTKGSVALFDTQAVIPPAQHALATPLLSLVTAPWRMDSLLAGIYVAESLNEALQLRSQLQAHESVITRDGIWMGNGWLRVARDPDEKAGVLQREHELKELGTERVQLEGRETELASALETGRDRLRELEANRESLQIQLNQLHRRRADAQSELSGLQARMEQMRARHAQIADEIRELESQSAQGEEELLLARRRLQETLDRMESFSTRRSELEQQREQLRTQLDQARVQARTDRDAAQELRLKVQSARTTLASARQSIERIQTQLTQLTTRADELKRHLEESEAPMRQLRAELDRQLEQRVGVQNELTAARRAVEEIDHALRERSGQRQQVEQESQQVRSGLEQARMSVQELRVRRQTIEEQLTETGFVLATVIESLPADAVLDVWQESVDRASAQIARLGAINLAAIDEFKEGSERKVYLDAQFNDLTEALTTLENAIRKIDRETRDRFKETFDRIDLGFKEKFPRLFGGGTAYLEMTGEDLLDAGVTVMARPPGKRNSTIHLLSGGEKALTAVALVFSIFELNPAPFCMLDEVDAPLDEANVGRFCNLVREMSQRVQFVFITHNKNTMELADQLNGVTMHEPGVSRLVAVDVDEAVRMAAI
jgi:chromosome segregation protein